MSALRLLALALLTSSALVVGRPAAAQPALAPEARVYLSTALDTLQAVILGADTLPWPEIRDSAFALARGARSPAETYGALEWALRRANEHSFLQGVSPPGAVSELLDGGIGYLHVPQRGGSAVPLADSLHTAVRALSAAGACAWIVDLRGNGGGNMWPMLAGVGPLLGDSVVGSFGGEGDSTRWFYRQGMSGLIHPDGRIEEASRVTVEPLAALPPTVPVAVLVDGGTGSSGEAVAVAFHGRPNARSFGAPTAGFATANRGSRLPDGANMVVTTGFYRDRRGVAQGPRLTPDVQVDGFAAGWPFATDRVAAAAAEWLRPQAACRAG